MAGQLGVDQYGGVVTAQNQQGNVLSLILGALQSLVSLLGGGSAGSSGLPYGADDAIFTNVVGGPGPTVIVYKKAGFTVKTRTISYTGSGPTDVVTEIKDT